MHAQQARKSLRITHAALRWRPSARFYQQEDVYILTEVEEVQAKRRGREDAVQCSVFVSTMIAGQERVKRARKEKEVFV